MHNIGVPICPTNVEAAGFKSGYLFQVYRRFARRAKVESLLVIEQVLHEKP